MHFFELIKRSIFAGVLIGIAGWLSARIIPPLLSLLFATTTGRPFSSGRLTNSQLTKKLLQSM